MSWTQERHDDFTIRLRSDIQNLQALREEGHRVKEIWFANQVGQSLQSLDTKGMTADDLTNAVVMLIDLTDLLEGGSPAPGDRATNIAKILPARG